MEDLESRLSVVNNNSTKDTLISTLATRQYARAANSNNPYYKYDLVDAIVGLIGKYAPVSQNFDSNLNSTLNKEEAKKIYYGLVAIDYNPQVKPIIEKLSDWEKVCFFAGVWTKRKMQGIRSESIAQIVQGYIKAGYDLMHKKHMIKFNTGEYARPLKIPESQDYRKDKTIPAAPNTLNTSNPLSADKPVQERQYAGEQLDLFK